MTKQIIGRTDAFDFPELNLYNIPVKIDTGAYTSAIHCSEIREVGPHLHCRFFNEKHLHYNSNEVIFTTFTFTKVKSSNGITEKRYKVKSEVIIFGKTYKINLTLSTRSDMRFPVLIGRQFLKKRFLVDVDKQNLSLNLKA